MRDIKVLDCTLRDGGYYNNWDFSTDLVRTYISAMDQAGIDYIEMGLRTRHSSSFKGAYAFTTDEWLQKLPKTNKSKFGVMINASEYLEKEGDTKSALNCSFKKKKDSQIELVRVAAHFDDVEESESIVVHLKSLGYQVGLNLMQIGRYSLDMVKEKVRQINIWGNVDVLYIADSFGNMSSENILDLLSVIRSEWSGDMGIHAHDNMGHALNNSM